MHHSFIKNHFFFLFLFWIFKLKLFGIWYKYLNIISNSYNHENTLQIYYKIFQFNMINNFFFQDFQFWKRLSNILFKKLFIKKLLIKKLSIKKLSIKNNVYQKVELFEGTLLHELLANFAFGTIPKKKNLFFIK